MKNNFAILSGEPDSINIEIIARVWKQTKKSKRNFFVIGNYKLFNHQLKKLRIKIKTKKIFDNLKDADDTNLNILDVPINSTNLEKINIKNNEKYIKRCLDLAHKFSNNKIIKGFINCPINKKKANLKNIGVTEYLSKKCGNLGKEAMLLYGNKFSVSPITTHIPLQNVNKKITKKNLINKIITINNYYRKYFKKKPSITVLGLNPHNGEFSKLSQEKKYIQPAIRFLKKKGLNIIGPIPADSIPFRKKTNVIVGMYHDQVLPIFKMAHKFNAVNVTLGLKYTRMSPDHGTAAGLKYKNLANLQSLKESINLFNKIND